MCQTQPSSQAVEKQGVGQIFPTGRRLQTLLLKLQHLLIIIISYGSGSWLASARRLSFMWFHADGGWAVSGNFLADFLTHVVEGTHIKSARPVFWNTSHGPSTGLSSS